MDKDKSINSDQVFKDSVASLTEKEKIEHKHITVPKKYSSVPHTEFADPKNNKYPVNSPERVRAAWSYIHNSKNSGEYSSSELASIKSKIREAAKKHGVNLSENK